MERFLGCPASSNTKEQRRIYKWHVSLTAWKWLKFRDGVFATYVTSLPTLTRKNQLKH
jgi:hypothetical protein